MDTSVVPPRANSTAPLSRTPHLRPRRQLPAYPFIALPHCQPPRSPSRCLAPPSQLPSPPWPSPSSPPSPPTPRAPASSASPTSAQPTSSSPTPNDLWLTARDGGDAIRLTSSEGAETDAAFSPDGRWIAFTGQYDGNTDVYLMPATGGQPQRLTWHPSGDVAQGWTPDGDILFRSGRDGVPTQLWKFYTVSPSGGLPTPLALPQAYLGGISADGAHLAYQEIGYWDPEWRNYRGGQAQPIGIVSTSTWERVTPPWEGERQMDPVWMDGVVYYMSERDWAGNVWSFDPRTGTERQVTRHADFDVKSLGAGDGVVVYEQAGYLHELDPATGASRQLVINVAGDMNWSRPRWESVAAGQLRDARLSPPASGRSSNGAASSSACPPRRARGAT